MPTQNEITPESILADLAVIGCELRADGDRLYVSGLTDAETCATIRITGDMHKLILERLKEQKLEIIKYLEARYASAV